MKIDNNNNYITHNTQKFKIDRHSIIIKFLKQDLIHERYRIVPYMDLL